MDMGGLKIRVKSLFYCYSHTNTQYNIIEIIYFNPARVESAPNFEGRFSSIEVVK